MQALILAGGFGTRMQQHFPDTHKCMLLVAGKPVLQYQIECLKKNNIKDILIYVCHKKDQIKYHFKDGKEFGVNIRYIEDDELHSTANHLLKAALLLEEEFIVMYGDQVVQDVNFKRLERLHKKKGSFATFFTHKDVHPKDSDNISIDDNGKITGFGDVMGQTNTAIFMTNIKILKYIKGEEDISKDIIPKMIKENDCYALEADGYIKDIGTITRYHSAIYHINGLFKVLFVFPNMYTPYSFSPAIQLLSAILKKNDINVGMVHINNELGIPDDDKILMDHIRSHNPRIVAFTATSFEFERVDKIARLIKKQLVKKERLHITTLLGGSHATICPHDIKDSYFDAFCIGEGEKPFLNYVMALRARNPSKYTQSIWVRKGMVRNPIEDIYKDLNDLPFLDLDIMDTRKILHNKNNWFSISFSRGCPFECSYCINHLYKKIKGKDVTLKQYLRKKTPLNSIKEMEYVLSRFKQDIKVFNLDDDLIMLDRKWMKDFCRLYKARIFKRYDIPFVINARVSTLDFPMARMLKDSGCIEVRIGVESGDRYIRYSILNKPITNEQIVDAFDNCKTAGLNADAFVMVGMPEETHERIKHTMELMIRIKPHLIRLSILFPYKHSKIYDYCKEHKLLSNKRDLTDMFSDTILQLKDLSRADIVRYHMLFPWYMNALMYPGTVYDALLGRYSHAKHSQLLASKEHITNQDKWADDQFDRPHFRFFKGNPYYVEYVEGI